MSSPSITAFEDATGTTKFLGGVGVGRTIYDPSRMRATRRFFKLSFLLSLYLHVRNVQTAINKFTIKFKEACLKSIGDVGRHSDHIFGYSVSVPTLTQLLP